jgi:ATP-dependent DNA helicase RecQ
MFLQNGGRVDADRVLEASSLDPATQEQVIAAFQRLGFERLAPVFEAMGGAVSYAELHLLRVYLLARRLAQKP